MARSNDRKTCFNNALAKLEIITNDMWLNTHEGDGRDIIRWECKDETRTEVYRDELENN